MGKSVIHNRSESDDNYLLLAEEVYDDANLVILSDSHEGA